jgi:hypothetical protein
VSLPPCGLRATASLEFVGRATHARSAGGSSSQPPLAPEHDQVIGRPIQATVQGVSELAHRRQASYADVLAAPDWVCEVLSPGTERTDRAVKLPIYAREGVRHAWLVNPLLRTLEILRLDGGRWTYVATYAGDQQIRAEPFDAIVLELGVLWADVTL